MFLLVVTDNQCQTVAPPQLSKEQIAILETEANSTVKSFVATAVVLYICKPCPHASPILVHTYAYACMHFLRFSVLTQYSPSVSAAPFVVEAVSNFF